MQTPIKYLKKSVKIFKKPILKDNVVVTSDGSLLEGDYVLTTLPDRILPCGFIVKVEREVSKCRDCGTLASKFVRTSSHWVCPQCGLCDSVLIDSGPERILDDEGHMDSRQQRFGFGDCEIPRGFKGVMRNTYKERHGRFVLKQIRDLTSGMNMPEVVYTYAQNIFKIYLKKIGRQQIAQSPWSLTAAAVYAGTLIHEYVICQPFAQTREKICKVAERYRRASSFIQNNGRKKRIVTMKRVDKYTRMFQKMGILRPEISIPPLSIISDTIKTNHIQNRCRQWALFNKSQTQECFLPSNQTWGIDLEIKQGILTIVDIQTSSIAWDAGLRVGDMIININDIATNNQMNIDLIYQTLVQEKKNAPSVRIRFKRNSLTKNHDEQRSNE